MKTSDRKRGEKETAFSQGRYKEVAGIILKGLGGRENILSVTNCMIRLRLEVKDTSKVDEEEIKSSGIAGVIRIGENSIHVVIGIQVLHIVDDFKKLAGY